MPKMPTAGALARLATICWVGALGTLGTLEGAAPRPAAAHELGPFQIFGTFKKDGSFQLDVKVDDEHLPAGQMGGPARRTRFGPIAGLQGAAEQRFGRFLSDLADSLTLRFDGREVTPELRMDPDTGDPAAPARVTMLMRGWIPGGAHTFTLETSLPVKTFPLVLDCEGDETSAWKWVAGGEASPPFTLAPFVVPPARSAVLRAAVVRGFAAVLPFGPARLLVVAALLLLVRRLAAAALQVAAFAGGGWAGLVLASGGGGVGGGRLGGLSEAATASLEALLLAGLALACVLARQAGPAGRATEAEARATGAEAFGEVAAAGEGGAPARAVVTAALLALAVGFGGVVYGAALRSALPPLAIWAPQAVRAACAGVALGACAAEMAALVALWLLIGWPFAAKVWYRRRVVVPAGCLIAAGSFYWSLAPLFG